MNNTTPNRTGRHVVFNLHAHLVFAEKYRKNIFSKNMIDCLKGIFSKVCDDMEAVLVNYPPKLSLSKLVNSLKGVSSRMLRKEFKSEIEKFLYNGVLWSPSYFVSSCGGAPISIVKKYIDEQESPAS
jgi:putative transposase